jgi:hypothetical protein
LSQKLIPAPIPRQTKHNQKNQALKELGSSNKTIDNYFIRSEPLKESVADPNIDPNLEFLALDDHQNQSDQQTAQEAAQLRHTPSAKKKKLAQNGRKQTWPFNLQYCSTRKRRRKTKTSSSLSS